MMESGEADVLHADTRRAVRQAILLNEHLLRRAWGVLFIVIAFSMFLSIFGVAILEVAKSFGVQGSIALAMTGTGLGLIVILWTFKRVRFAVELTHPEGDPPWARLLGYQLLAPLWIGANAVMAMTVALAAPLLPSVFSLTHLGLAAYAYYAVRLSYSKKIPLEAMFAVGSLSLCSIATLVLLPFVRIAGPYALLWGATIVAWALSGAFARTRPIPEFDEERTGLE